MAQALAHSEHPQTTTGLDHRKMVMWAFLGSDTLFFGSLIATYLLYKGKSVEGPYPYEVFNIPYTSISAFVLLMSSLTMVLALAAIQKAISAASRYGCWLRHCLARSSLEDSTLSSPSLLSTTVST